MECNTISWINDEPCINEIDCLVQIRHQHKPINCKIFYKENKYVVDFENHIRGVAPGQSAVFYKDNICLGGGVISKAF